MRALVVLTTLSKLPAARHLAKDLVRFRLAACVSMIPRVESHYPWKGKLTKSAEILLVIKTTSRAWPKLSNYLKQHHPYKLPEIIAFPATRGSKKYFAWIKQWVR